MTSSWPRASPKPALIATWARRSSFCSKVRDVFGSSVIVPMRSSYLHYQRTMGKPSRGFAPSFSAQVRFGEPGAPVQGGRDGSLMGFVLAIREGFPADRERH